MTCNIKIVVALHYCLALLSTSLSLRFGFNYLKSNPQLVTYVFISSHNQQHFFWHILFDPSFAWLDQDHLIDTSGWHVN